MLNLYFDKINFVKCLVFVRKKKKKKEKKVFIEVCAKFSLMENTDFSLSALFTKYNKPLHPSMFLFKRCIDTIWCDCQETQRV